MPFTDEQFPIIQYLGLPFNDASLALVNGRLTAIEDEEFITLIQDNLSQLDTLETAIATAAASADPATSQLKTEARKFVNRIALALELEVRNDVF